MTVPRRWVEMGEKGLNGLERYLDELDYDDVAAAALAPVLADLRRQVEALPIHVYTRRQEMGTGAHVQWASHGIDLHDLLALLDTGGTEDGAQ